jgi:hypothetical protein
LFAAAGEVLAAYVLRGDEGRVAGLADVMARRMVDVRRAALSVHHEPTRVQIALAAAALAWVRPDLEGTCRKAIQAFLAPLGPAAWSFSSDTLAARGVLADAVGDAEEATLSLTRERERGQALGAALVKWARSARDGQPLTRSALWSLAGRLPAPVSSALLVAAAWSGRPVVAVGDRAAALSA